MHAMWRDETCYVGDAAASASERQARAARKETASYWAPRHERGTGTSYAAVIIPMVAN
jgi:hypothetical protein